MFNTRYNSTIKHKIGLCVDCPHEVEQVLVAGRCPYHNKKHRYEQSQKRAKNKSTGKDLLEKSMGIATPQSNLVFWYAARIKERSGKCMECGEPIPLAFAHHSIAHILPKSSKNGFPSVATNEHNWIELGASCGCHHRFDSSWEKASKMKVFAIAKLRFQKFEPLIAPEERRRIPECFLK